MTLRPLFPLIAIGLLVAAPAAAADPGIEWVTVGDPGNPPDAATGRGAVAGPFQISKHEVTVGQYAEFLNAVAKNDPHGLWNGGLPIARTGDPGAFAYAAAAGREREPVVRVTFLDCMRFANWLHHLQGAAPADPAQLTETGAYDLAAGGGLAARSPGARAWIPNQDEWYKAAYHQPHAAGGPAGHYWRYPTKSDAQPTAGRAGDASPNVANFMLGEADARAVMPVGSFPNAAGHYGTFDQGGQCVGVGRSCRLRHAADAPRRQHVWQPREAALRHPLEREPDPPLSRCRLSHRPGDAVGATARRGHMIHSWPRSLIRLAHRGCDVLNRKSHLTK